jgi:hypothetical protein
VVTGEGSDLVLRNIKLVEVYDIASKSAAELEDQTAFPLRMAST